MKSIILALFFGMMLIVSTPVSSQVSTPLSTIQTDLPALAQGTPIQVAQEKPAPAVKVSFFAKIWNSAKDGTLLLIVTYICGIFTKNGWTKIIKAAAGKTAIGTEVGVNVLQSVHNLADLIDKSIKDDNTVDQNTLKEAITAGKAVVTTFKDAVVIIKPKPATVVPAV